MSVADLQILVEKLQTKINQLELTSKGAINALIAPLLVSSN